MKKKVEKSQVEDNEELERLLFKQVERPKGVKEVKIVNVYDNKYRINIWTSVEEDGFTKNKIHGSYFAKLENGNLILKQ
jgi:hypothetical protein